MVFEEVRSLREGKDFRLIQGSVLLSLGAFFEGEKTKAGLGNIIPLVESQRDIHPLCVGLICSTLTRVLVELVSSLMVLAGSEQRGGDKINLSILPCSLVRLETWKLIFL